MSSRDATKYAAMRPYFAVVTEGLAGLVGGTDFFDMHAEDVVVEYVITVARCSATINRCTIRRCAAVAVVADHAPLDSGTSLRHSAGALVDVLCLK